MEWSGRFTQGEVLDPVLVSSLQSDTNYTFQAVAMNSLGPGSLSMEYIFTTGTKLCITFIITAEPLNKGHLGTHSFLSLNIVLNGEVSSFQRFQLGQEISLIIEVFCIVSLTQRVLYWRFNCILKNMTKLI